VVSAAVNSMSTMVHRATAINSVVLDSTSAVMRPVAAPQARDAHQAVISTVHRPASNDGNLAASALGPKADSEAATSQWKAGGLW
jgi:hypothetical protein